MFETAYILNFYSSDIPSEVQHAIMRYKRVEGIFDDIFKFSIDWAETSSGKIIADFLVSNGLTECYIST